MDTVLTKNCVVYVRVSSEKQVDGYSLDSQDDLCRKRAVELGYTVVKVFREEGVSASTTNRPELQDLLTYCKVKENNISAVFIYSFSRLNRNTVDFLTLRHLLAKIGISVNSVTEPGGDSPEQRFIETILAAKDQMENETRARNVANSLRKRFLEGHITAKPPIGYLMQKVDGKARAVKDPELFNLIRSFWHRILKEKLTLTDIANQWNKLGIRSLHDSRFKKFRRQSISKIFNNKFYMGILVSEKYGEVKGLHEPMVDEITFYQVKIWLNRRPQTPARYHLREDFPIRGLLICPLCNKKLTSGWSKHHQFAYYNCFERHDHKYLGFPVKIAEDKFIELLKSIKPTDRQIKFFTKILKEKYDARYNQFNDSFDWVQKDIDKLEEMLITIREKNATGVYTDEEYLKFKDDIKTRIVVKKGLLSEKRIDIIEIDTVLKFMRFYLTHLDTLFIKASPEGRLKIGSSMFPVGVVFDGKVIRTPILGRGYQLTRDFLTSMSRSVSRQGLEP